jgi:hypothetical protein
VKEDLCDIVVFVYYDATVFSRFVPGQVAVQQMQGLTTVMYLPVMIPLGRLEGIQV